MPIKSPDYRMLMDLRSCLIAVPPANKNLSVAKQHLQSLQNDMDSLDQSDRLIHVKTPEYDLHVQQITRDYQDKVLSQRRAEAAERGKKLEPACERSKRFMHALEMIVTVIFRILQVILVGIAIVGPIVSAVMLFKHQKLGYTFYMTHHWVAVIGQWDSIFGKNLYFIGVALAICAVGFLLPAVFGDSAVGDCGMTIGGLTLAGSLIYAGLMPLYLWGVRGAWWILGVLAAFFVSPGVLILFIGRILYAILITLVVLLLIIGPALLGFLVMPINDLKDVLIDALPEPRSVNYNDYDKEVDLTPLQTTTEYIEAQEQDRKENREKYKAYCEAVEAERSRLKTQYSSLIQAQLHLICETEQHINACNKLIQETPIHHSYKNVHSLNCLLYYFNYDLASTMKEAANLWRNDTKLQQFMGMLQKQHGELMASQQAILAGQSAIRDQIYQANREMAQRWERHEAELQKQHNEKLAAIQHLEREQSRISLETRNAIQSASNSINNSIGNLHTAVNSDTNYIAQQLGTINRTIDRK